MSERVVDRVVVVIPARDEQETIGAALDAVASAALQLPTGVRVEAVVVANGCSDDTAQVARAAGAHVIEGATPNVGAARARGCEWAVQQADGLDGVWIACTDADSVVPDEWLLVQVTAASAGADLFLGTIALEPWEVARHATWAAQYLAWDADVGHGHVHGASLGVRASTYARAGGFRDLAAHEDVDLVARLLDAGARAVWSPEAPVTTSARHRARLVGGVATDLAASAGLALDDIRPPSSAA